ncbi:hypothetical protein Ndes2437A_g03235 [Nannochloris sp. 'desiccata']
MIGLSRSGCLTNSKMITSYQNRNPAKLNEFMRSACRPMHRHPKKSIAANSGQGFGKKANEAKDDHHKYQDEILNQRSVALAATDILARLLHAEENALEVATEFTGSLTEEFFHISSAYLQMAKKDADDNVAFRLERAIKAAMEAKNATLRPEIQLLNKLLGSETELERKQVLNTKQAGETLTMNNYYFFNLLDTMMKDVDRQPDGPQKVELQEKQQAVKSAALGRLPPEDRAKVPDGGAKK